MLAYRSWAGKDIYAQTIPLGTHGDDIDSVARLRKIAAKSLGSDRRTRERITVKWRNLRVAIECFVSVATEVQEA